jgi:D-3-phosphoglycerate dehydrogenase
MANVVLYLDKLNKHMEQMLIDMAPSDVDVRFLKPNVGKQGNLEDATCFFVTNYEVTKEVIDAAPNLKLIQRTGIGVDNVDVEYATKKGIPVSISKGFNASSVAELAILDMLALYRKIVTLDPLTKKGEWHTWTYRHESFELLGKTIGVIGSGTIGREVMKRLKPFGTSVIYYDVYRMPEELEKEIGATYVEFEDLVCDSDIITLHIPWLPSTENLIGEKQFKQMKNSAVLINTARGPIVDQKALVNALKKGEIWGAASDVYSSEPADPNDPLFKLENVNLITTPHLGAATYDNYYRVFDFALSNTQRVGRNEKAEFVINEI